MEAIKRRCSVQGCGSHQRCSFRSCCAVPAAVRPCPTLAVSPVSPASPNPASRSFPGHKSSMVNCFLGIFLFFFSAHEIQTQLCTSSFPGKLFSSCKKPFFFFFNCLPAFFSHSGSRKARAWAGSSAGAARHPSQGAQPAGL